MKKIKIEVKIKSCLIQNFSLHSLIILYCKTIFKEIISNNTKYNIGRILNISIRINDLINKFSKGCVRTNNI